MLYYILYYIEHVTCFSLHMSPLSNRKKSTTSLHVSGQCHGDSYGPVDGYLSVVVNAYLSNCIALDISVVLRVL